MPQRAQFTARARTQRERERAGDEGGRRVVVRGDEGGATERGAGGARSEAVGAEGGASAPLARPAGASRDRDPRRAVRVDVGATRVGGV